MLQISIENNFASWRAAARDCLQKEIAPDEIFWTINAANNLFASVSTDENVSPTRKVSAEFLALAETVACFDDDGKWALLYRILFRLVNENRYLLHIESDEDVRRARLMEKAVARDVHKFHAFVRFRKTVIDEQEIYVAWHEPQHLTVERSAPFFVRRFGAMRFSILTPKLCAHWDKENLTFSPGVAAENAPKDDATEDFWLVYYRSIFNPFRLKIKAMKAELPVRHWRTLPEARLIPEMIQNAQDLTRKWRSNQLKSSENKDS